MLALDRPVQRVENLGEVSAHWRLGGAAIARFERGEYRPLPRLSSNDVDNIRDLFITGRELDERARVGPDQLEGRPQELLQREDFEQLFVGAGPATAPSHPDEEEDRDR